MGTSPENVLGYRAEHKVLEIAKPSSPDDQRLIAVSGFSGDISGDPDLSVLNS